MQDFVDKWRAIVVFFTHVLVDGFSAANVVLAGPLVEVLLAGENAVLACCTG